MIPINDAPFEGLAQRELTQVLNTADHRFFGLRMSQHPQAVIKLNQLLNATQPARIVEIGAGNGGLTVLFALYCGATGAALHAYDQQDGEHLGLLREMGRPVELGDVFDPRKIEEIKGIIARPGRTLLLCDCGKALEFNLLAPALKVGDFALMHDHATDHATFERDIKGKIWNWHESWDARVAEACAKHGIVQTTYLHDTVWFCGWRTA